MNKPLLIVLAILMSASAAQACIWDRDTLAMERARFPEVNELIVGYFPRHSPPYYQWRIEQVQAIPLAERRASDYDDLAVSFDKLDQHERAIETMLAKAERFPVESIYKTHANLGTFYIHNGDLEQGAQHIENAIEINPDAHFGREVYQQLLVAYIIQQQAKGNTLPLSNRDAHGYQREDGFAAYVLKQQGVSGTSWREELAEVERALKGVQGMMRFGHYDSPVLLEVLGDLLLRTGSIEGAQRLAARAYLKASMEASDPEAAQTYREKAQFALSEQQGVTFEEIEAKLKEEIVEGDAYFAKIESDTKAWILAGKDVDVEFSAVYYDSPTIVTSKADRRPIKSPSDQIFQFAMIFMGLLIIAVAALLYALIFFLKRRKARARRAS